MKVRLATTGILLLAMIMASGVAVPAKDKIKIEKLDDLPRHTYQVDIKAVDFLSDDEALLELAGELEADLKSDLDTYEIPDKTTLQDYYNTLAMIAMLGDRYDDYLKYSEKARDLEDKEAKRLTMGQFGRAYVTAMRAETVEKEAVLRREYKAAINGLPYEVVADQLKSAKARAEILSETIVGGSLEANVQPVLDGGDGTISKEIAKTIVSAAYTVHHFVPFKEVVVSVLSDYLNAHKVEKENIWKNRRVVLEKSCESCRPVTVAIWDSGLDTEIFEESGHLWVNTDEVPGNDKDDDNNGFVDDVHGIAYDLHSNKISEPLYPLKSDKDRDRLQRLYKGLTDLQANIDSEAASELKKVLSSLKREEVGPFIEDINRYGNHAHGTHVGGIAARGNPFVRLMVSRITFDYRMIPETPTVEQARKDSVATVETLQYYKDNGARVVNMSWGGSIAMVEQALEKNNAGGTPEERKELARTIFVISKGALYEGIKNTPEILYITSAGNADNDVNFEEFIPSTFDLPNILSIGAVDQAGDETGFTSFGKVDVYANGYEVESYVPGGDRMPMSGTSMSSPNVTNLAAKLFTLRPELTPVQAKELIIKASEEHAAGERTVKLIDPKKTVKLLASMKEMGSLEK